MTNAESILAVVTDGMVFPIGAYEVTLTTPQAAGNMFSAWLVVRSGGVVVFNELARIVNPPLQVPDSSGDIVVPGYSELNPITNIYDVFPEQRFFRDPLRAIKIIIADTIKVKEQ